MKWIMHSHDKFTAEQGGYSVVLTLHKKQPPIWEIFDDGDLIDAAYYHSPVTTDFNKELAGKAQAEKYLNKLLNTVDVVKVSDTTGADSSTNAGATDD